MLEVGGQLGISEIAISGLRRVAGSIVWNFNPKNFRRRLKNKSIRMGQLFFGRWGFTLGAAVSQSEVIRLARLIKPVPYSSALIRVGGPKDGGYLVPDDLEGVVSCFSPGVATTASFELDLAGLGINSYLADFSVDGPPFQNPMFDFEKKFIGVESDDTMYVRLDDWVQSKHRVAGDLILQMDIEGAEWPILADVSQETLEKFRIIVIELHDLDQMMTSVSGSRVVESVFRKLRSRFWTVHLHPNNCCPPTRYQGLDIPPVMEVTLLRKDRLKGLKTGDQVQIPHPLDAKNVQAYKNVDLAAYWYANQI
jgi:hypothetical protein